MTINYEAEYNNRARVPEHEEIFARWASDADAYRAQANCDLDLAYGDAERQKVDVFHPNGTASQDAPLIMFIHGGYWRSLDRTVFSHLAKGLNAHGFSVALPSYTLAPDASVQQIIDEMVACTRFLHNRHGKKIVASGHSAGGHLAACLLATDWPKLDPGLPADLVSSALAVSGVFDLRPLIHTTNNDALKLDEAMAARVSPILWEVPKARTMHLHILVGGAESHEFIRQSKDMAERWAAQGAKTAYHETPSANHFTVIDALADAGSPLTQDLSLLANHVAG
ncbi:MAG: alpha/beta hydrolase [Pseudomonadota bacterium]